MKWIDRLKAKIIHALGGLTRAEATFPAPIAQVLHYDIQTVRTVKIVPAFTSRRPSGSFSRMRGSGRYEKLRTNRHRRRNLR